MFTARVWFPLHQPMDNAGCRVIPSYRRLGAAGSVRLHVVAGIGNPHLSSLGVSAMNLNLAMYDIKTNWFPPQKLQTVYRLQHAAEQQCRLADRYPRISVELQTRPYNSMQMAHFKYRYSATCILRKVRIWMTTSR